MIDAKFGNDISSKYPMKEDAFRSARPQKTLECDALTLD